jgi:hypothetical protein
MLFRVFKKVFGTAFIYLVKLWNRIWENSLVQILQIKLKLFMLSELKQILKSLSERSFLKLVSSLLPESRRIIYNDYLAKLR